MMQDICVLICCRKELRSGHESLNIFKMKWFRQAALCISYHTAENPLMLNAVRTDEQFMVCYESDSIWMAGLELMKSHRF